MKIYSVNYSVVDLEDGQIIHEHIEGKVIIFGRKNRRDVAYFELMEHHKGEGEVIIHDMTLLFA